jgi:hypothetical protein
MSGESIENEKRAAAEAAAELVVDGARQRPPRRR